MTLSYCKALVSQVAIVIDYFTSNFFLLQKLVAIEPYLKPKLCHFWRCYENWKVRENWIVIDVRKPFRKKYDNNYWQGIGEEISSGIMNITF